MRALSRWPSSGRIVLLLSFFATACGQSGSPASCPSPGGAVAGSVDTHCAMTVQSTAPSSCHPAAVDGGMVMPDGGMMMADGGMMMSDGGGEEPAAVRYNATGDDDDCKYHLDWSATPVCETEGVTFTVTVTRKADGAPATGAAPRIEATLGDTHPAPNSGQTATEHSPGTYALGPVVIDAAGRWTVRFHLYETCGDALADSPHGHASFYLDVP